MTYDLALQLKDAGFPQSPYMNQLCQHPDSMACRIKAAHNPECEWVSVPTLSELIEACGDDLFDLRRDGNGWAAISNLTYDGKFDSDISLYGEGSTPEEAVSMLWISLNKK